MLENFSSIELQLYRRQMILPEWGAAAQNTLKDAHLVVVGAGGLGSPALLYLAAAGIGTLTVIDDDQVELSNLHRQIIHTFAAAGNSKTESAAYAMRSLNPTITVRTVQERLSNKNAHSLFADADAVLDGSDNFETRYLVSRACAEAGIPHIWGAILGFDAQMSVFWQGRGPVYEDLYPVMPAPGSVPNCATAGVLGPLAGVVGTSMALETLKLLTGVGIPMIGTVGYYSGLDGRWDYIPLKASERRENTSELPFIQSSENSQGSDEPSVTIGHKNFIDVSSLSFESPQEVEVEQIEGLLGEGEINLIDVREKHEFDALAIPGAIHLPLSRLEQLQNEGGDFAEISELLMVDDKPVILYCAAGVRSLRAQSILADAGVGAFASLAGGINAWLENA
ncbi:MULTISPECIES: ThiF family adenylyltransferase [unclassified Rothia (in: high G+C Gram-positive bacteria)]|uniref:ThiF family adenylyltransferase n=1 Tax=unclassified Rothia (in: high G+C Gram-positive bacteria) TaxID=2689056 RepID=UPI00195D3E07|nr:MULTISPECIES: ThiF family adenylyltransferase [unclassified Rothia (in: high G+C Gram-positive bacteria)]MBM7051856.1 ThiF family adenylyltransferase [Rothia sp. ZJ1223]QRZ62060.1 ThiF family adenylyltransferase [Rothia sp. ZJ932]